jgi:hypothetical protein
MGYFLCSSILAYDPAYILKKIWPLLNDFLANSSARPKLAVLPNWPFSEICKTRQNCWHSPYHLPRTRQTCRHSPSRLPSTRQTRRHSPNRFARQANFEKNVTHLAKFAQVMSESREFGASSHCLILTLYMTQIKAIQTKDYTFGFYH